MSLVCGLSFLFWSSQDAFPCSFCQGEWGKQQAQIFKELRLIPLHKKQIISSCQKQSRAQTSLAIESISCEDLPFPVDLQNQAVSHRKIALLLLFFLGTVPLTGERGGKA